MLFPVPFYTQGDQGSEKLTTCPPSHRERSATLQGLAWLPSPHFQKPNYTPFLRSPAPEPPTHFLHPKGLQLSSSLATGWNRGGSFVVLTPPPRTSEDSRPKKIEAGLHLWRFCRWIVNRKPLCRKATGGRVGATQPVTGHGADSAPWLRPSPAQSGPRPAPPPPWLLLEDRREERREGGHTDTRQGGRERGTP